MAREKKEYTKLSAHVTPETFSTFRKLAKAKNMTISALVETSMDLKIQYEEIISDIAKDEDILMKLAIDDLKQREAEKE